MSEGEIDRTQHMFYDPNRQFYLAKIHDGEGNIYVFNCAPDIPLKIKNILDEGELISFRLKGKTSKKIDSSSDLFARSYNKIQPLEFKDSKLDRTEFDTLLAMSKKKAPIPGKETLRAAPPADIPAAPPAETLAPSPAPDSIHGPVVGTFQDHNLYQPNPQRSPYVLIEKICVNCNATIHGKAPVSGDGHATPRRLQAFAPFDNKARLKYKGGHAWLCPKCSPLSQWAKSTEESPHEEIPAKRSGFTKEAWGHDKPDCAPDEIIETPNFFRFERYGEVYYYKGARILDINGSKRIRMQTKCGICGEPINMQAPVTFHNGKPHCVAARKPIVKGEAIPLRPRSLQWKHTTCSEPRPAPELPVEEVAPTIPEHVPHAKPVPSLPQTGYTKLFATLENLVMDANLEDKAFRGAVWALCRYAASIEGDLS